MAKYRPSVAILACSDNPTVVKQMSMSRGIVGYLIPKDSNESLITQALNHAKDTNLCKPGRKAIYLHDMMEERVDEFAMKEIVDVE